MNMDTIGHGSGSYKDRSLLNRPRLVFCSFVMVFEKSAQNLLKTKAYSAKTFYYGCMH